MSERSYDANPPHGSMAEEAVKLAEVAHLWLSARSESSARDRARDVWASATEESADAAGAPPECRGCPVCRARRALADVNPEVYQHLAEATSSLAAALQALSRDPERR